MKNYMKSEFRRLRKKKVGYVVLLLGIALLVGAAFGLDFMSQRELEFPYATNMFYYSSIFVAPNFLLMLTGTLAIVLIGRDRDLISVSIGFGVNRSHIFWGKYFVTLINFLIIGAIFFGVAYASGEMIVPNTEVEHLHRFINNSLNLLPILLSALTVTYVIAILFNSEISAFILILLIYRVINYASSAIIGILPQSKPVFDYLPGTLFSELSVNYLTGNVQLEYVHWGINLGIILVFLLLGSLLYRRKSY
jgi:membrane protein